MMMNVRAFFSTHDQVVCMYKYRSALCLVLVALVVVMVAGCGQHSRFASQLATPTGPIAVEATVDDVGRIETSLDDNVPKVILTFGDGRSVVVRQDQILVDGRVYPGLPAGAKKVEIEVSEGTVVVLVDGKVVVK
jgi:hypothetical protein